MPVLVAFGAATRRRRRLYASSLPAPVRPDLSARMLFAGMVAPHHGSPVAFHRQNGRGADPDASGLRAGGYWTVNAAYMPVS